MKDQTAFRGDMSRTRCGRCIRLMLLSCSTLAIGATFPSEARAQELDHVRLRHVEERVLPPVVREGAPRFTTLTDYYGDTNQELVERFERAKSAFESGHPRPFRMITLLAGDAGIGKSFVKNAAFKRGYPETAVCRFDIADLYEAWQQQDIAEARPDLYATTTDGRRIVLNRLPAIRQDQPLLLRQYLDSKEASFFLIDSLDEIHPSDCRRVLDQIERFVFEGNRPFVHAVVLGRSIAFRDYWHARAGFYSPELLNLHVINPPKYETTGDLLVSTWNYHSFFHRLEWTPSSGERERMPFNHFASWSRADFSKEGTAFRVHYKPTNGLDSTVVDTLEAWTREHRVVNSMIYNLAGNAFIRQIAERYALANKPYDEEGVMREYLTMWLKRDTESNDRPSTSKPEYLSLYLHLLEEVAARYATEDRISDEGMFDVRYNDLITVNFEGQRLQFPAYCILDRSGLKHSDPRQVGSRRYRFEPIWLHRHLVQRHKRRHDKNAK